MENEPIGVGAGLESQTLLEGRLEAISIHSSASEILWANRCLCDVLGKTLAEIRGLSCEDAFHAGAACRHTEAVASRQSVEFETLLSGRPATGRIEPLLEGDHIAGFVRILVATPDLAAGERARQAERIASLGKMLFGMAHIVGTPLNIISGYAEYLLMRVRPEEPGYKELSAILDQTRRIAALFGETIEMARAPQGRRDPIELDVVVTGALDLAAHHLRAAEVKAELACRINAPLIYGEAAQLKLMLFGLLLEAAQGIGAGGRLEVVIDRRPDRPEYLSLELWGWEKEGQGHDFRGTFKRLVVAKGRTRAGRGSEDSLVEEFLSNAGAEIDFGRAGKRGVPVVIEFPLKSAVSPDGL